MDLQFGMRPMPERNVVCIRLAKTFPFSRLVSLATSLDRKKVLASQANVHYDSKFWAVSVGISAEIQLIKLDFQDIDHCSDGGSKRKVLATAEDMTVWRDSPIHFVHGLRFGQRFFELSILFLFSSFQ
jgi:hypothetical protein